MRFRYLLGNSVAALIICAGLVVILPARASRAETPVKPPEGASTYGLKVVPSKEEIVVRPAEETSFTIFATNQIAGDMDISISAWNFARDEHGVAYRISDKDAKKFRGAAQWLRFSKTLTRVAGGEKAPILITIETPKNAAPGTHTAYLAITGIPKVPDDQGIKTRFTINALILPIVISRSHDRGAILKTDVQALGLRGDKKWYLDPPINLTVKLKNSGNVHQNFEGAIEIWQGRVRLDRVQLAQTLLPEQVSTLVAQFAQPPYPGRMAAKLTGLAFLAKSNRQQRIRATTEFWYIPRVFIYVSAALLAFLGLILSFVIRRLLSKKRPKDRPIDEVPIADQPELDRSQV